MRRNLLLAGIVFLLLTLFVGSVAHAQSIAGDKFVLNEDFVLASGRMLDGRLAALDGSITLEPGSVVSGDVAAYGSKLEIAGTVQGNVAVFRGTVHLADTAVIEGDFVSMGAAVTRDPGARIRGETVEGLSRSRELPERVPKPPRPSLFGQAIRWQLGTLAWVLLMVVLGGLAMVVAPRAVERVARAAAAEPAMTFGLGLLTYIVALLCGALLLIACGLGLLVWLALLVASLLGWIAMGLWVGRRVFAALRVRSTTALGEVALGVMLITVLARLPWCIGFLFAAIVGSIGLGAVIVTRFGTQSSDEEPPAAAPPIEPLSDASLSLALSDEDDFEPPDLSAALVDLDDTPES